MKRIGVLLAAGESRRFGRPKQLLPWPPRAANSKPMVAAAFDAIARVCDEMIVVVGSHAEEVTSALGARQFVTIHSDSSAPLLYSICIGIARAAQIGSAADILVQLSDHPEVRRDTLEAMIACSIAHAGQAVMPQFRSQGGHPVLIPADVARLILDCPQYGGLRQFWLDHPELCHRLAVDDPGVVFDVDTPSDYDFYVQ